MMVSNMQRYDLTPGQEQEISEFTAEQSRQGGIAPEVTALRMLEFARLRGFEAFAKIKATQRALEAKYRRQPISVAQQALIDEYRESIRTSAIGVQHAVVRQQRPPQALPKPAYSSWADYLAKTSWATLKERCSRFANRANRKRLLSDPAKHRVDSLQVWQVMRNARGRCHHCGSLAVEGRPSDANGSPIAWEHLGRRIGSLEHVMARSRGGDNEFSNLAWSCLLCNNWVAEEEQRQGKSWRGKPDFGAVNSSLSGEPDAKQSDAIVAAKYEAETGKSWSEERAFPKSSARTR